MKDGPQTDRQRLVSEWTETCKETIEQCPIAFMPQFTQIMFTGQRLIIEASVCEQINAAKKLMEKVTASD